MQDDSPELYNKIAKSLDMGKMTAAQLAAALDRITKTKAKQARKRLYAVVYVHKKRRVKVEFSSSTVLWVFEWKHCHVYGVCCCAELRACAVFEFQGGSRIHLVDTWLSVFLMISWVQIC